MLTRMEQQVDIFRQAFNLPVSYKARMLSKEEAALHIQMIRDEFEKEMVPVFLDEDHRDLIEQYDVIIDMLVYILGMARHAGFAITPGFDEVMRSNMSKLGPNGKPIYAIEGDGSGEPEGKVLKGPDYREPNLHAIILAQGSDNICCGGCKS